MKLRMDEGLQSFRCDKLVLNVRSLGLNVKMELYEGVMVLTVTYKARIWSIRNGERRKLDVMKLRCG